MNVQIEIDGKKYSTVYNNQSDYYELNDLEFKTSGIHMITIKATDIFGNEYVEILKVRVFAKNKNNYVNEEDIAYIIDYRTLKIKDIQKVSNSIFLVAPSNYEITNEMAREEMKNKLSVSWLKNNNLN